MSDTAIHTLIATREIRDPRSRCFHGLDRTAPEAR
jgi:hypothetical protein